MQTSSEGGAKITSLWRVPIQCHNELIVVEEQTAGASALGEDRHTSYIRVS